MSDDTAVAPASSAEPKQYASVNDAVAELDRRETERRAQRRADKAEREERIAAEREKAAAEERKIERAAQRESDGEEAEDDDDPRRVAEDKPRKAKTKAQAPAEEADDDAEDDEEGDSEGEEVSAADDDAADDSDTGDDEDEAEEVSTRKPERLKVGDTEVEIPKGTPKAAVEALKALQHRLTADYTRKTQEAAETRKTATERAQAADALLQQVQRAQQAVVTMAERLIGNPPPLELARADPAAYLEAKESYEARVRDLQALTSHTGELTRSQQQQRQQAQQQALMEEAQRTVKVLPHLADPSKRAAFLDSAVRTASQSGFTPDDVAGVTDHRMLHLLHRLVHAESRLAAFEGASGSVKSKLANVAPKVMKGGSASNPSDGQKTKAERAKAEFLRSGRTLKDMRRYIDATS